MNPEKNESAESFERYLRPATFFLLSVAIGLSLWLNTGSARKESNAAVYERMTRTRSDLMFRLLVMEAINAGNLESKEEADFIKNAIIEQLKRLDEDPSFQSPQTEVQRRMILDHLGQDIERLSEEGLGPYRESFHLLYTAGKLPPEKDPLFLLPASRLALLRYYKTADHARYESMLATAREEAGKTQGLLTVGMLAFGASTLVAVFLLSRFFLRRPPGFFARFLESISERKRSVLLESAILYLFLVFPAGMVISRLVPGRVGTEFQMLYTICAAGIALLYFRSEIGLRTLIQTYWIPVIAGPARQEDAATPGAAEKEAGEVGVDVTVGGEGGAIEGNKTDRGNAVSVSGSGSGDGRNRMALVAPRHLVAREILFGVGAAAVFLPLLMLKTAVGVMIGGSQLEFRFVNPAALSGESDFWLLFFFAVAVVPVIEETVFRNWLYGALRFRFSVLFSAVLSAIFCSAFQPSGWWPFFLLPAIGLALLREFRPGLLAPVVAHSLLNALTLLAGWGLARI